MILTTHITPEHPAGKIVTNKTFCNGGCRSFVIDLYGKSSHVSAPHNGIDAIAMAVRVYSDIQLMRARELNPMEPVVIGIGQFHGGTANNITCDHATIHGTIRTARDEVNDYAAKRIEEIAQSVAKDMGGTAEVVFKPFNPAVRNDHALVDALLESAEKVVGADMIGHLNEAMGAEDFAYFMKYKPGARFSVGTQSADLPYVPVHNGKMVVDESGLGNAADVFIQFILDQMEK